MPITNFILDLLFPRLCVHCGADIASGAACAACASKIVRYDTFFCGKCRARVPGTQKICHRDFPYLLGAAGDYGDPVVKDMLHALKFEHVKDAAEPLGKLVADFILKIPVAWNEFAIVPIPLSKKRLRERGYNQAELIASVVSSKTGIPLRTDVLMRAKHTKEQSKVKGRAERMQNVDGVFALNSSNTLPLHIALLDDVTTSGATLLAAAEVLKAAGVKKIIALTVARA